MRSQAQRCALCVAPALLAQRENGIASHEPTVAAVVRDCVLGRWDVGLDWAEIETAGPSI